MSAIRELMLTDWSLALLWAQLRTPARRLASWWLAEFRDLWPETFLTGLQPDYRSAAVDRHLGKSGRNRRDAMVGVTLPPAAGVARSFEIPARARDRLQAIARQELEHRS